MKRYLPGGIIVAALLAIGVYGLTDEPPVPVEAPLVTPEPIEAALPNPYVEKLLAEYQIELAELIESTHTPGLAVAIVQDSTILLLKPFGVREAGTADSVDANTVFRLASVSKTFAPLLTGLLVEEGILSWNDRVIDHLPEFSLKTREATDSLLLTHVLSHTTGLPYHTYTTLVEDGKPLEEMLAALEDIDLIAAPGELYSYQNVAYSLIGAAIERATGKSYQTQMQERVFNRLGMRDASMDYESIAENPNVAQPHLQWGRGWRKTKISDTYYNVGPAGGVNASIADMAEVLKALLGAKHDFISEATLDRIYTPMIKARTKNRYFRKWIGPSDSHYALGWRVLQFANDTLLYHGGFVRGYRSEIALDRRGRIGICVLSNGAGRAVDNAVPMFFNMYYNRRDSILLWQRLQEPVRSSPDLLVGEWLIPKNCENCIHETEKHSNSSRRSRRIYRHDLLLQGKSG